MENIKKTENISEVLRTLDNIIDKCYESNSHLGYFPALYRNVTARIQRGIEDEIFQDNPRMDKFDTLFANKYFVALLAYWDNKPCSSSWRFAFEAPQSLTIIQHLMLGMNAHINFDLGLSASEVMEGKDVNDLKSDFETINNILVSMIQSNQEKIDNLSPWFRWLDDFFGTKDECFAEFSLVAARKFAWNWAQESWELSGERKDQKVMECDKTVKNLGCLISKPGLLSRIFLKLAKFREEKDPKKIITAFREAETQTFSP